MLHCNPLQYKEMQCNSAASLKTNRVFRDALDKYTNYGTNVVFDPPSVSKDGKVYCGPWACSYLLWIKNGRSGNTYPTFYNYASSMVGEFGVLNYVLRVYGRPMTPGEMDWALPVVSGGKIWFTDTWVFTDSMAYQHIKNKKPAIVLCTSNGELHYRVAVGALETGSRLAQTYKFLQHDNADKGKNSASRTSKNSYKTVEWWNPWFLVRD